MTPPVVHSCPALTPELVPPPSLPLPATAPWRTSTPSSTTTAARRRNSTHFFMYVPPLATDAEQREARAIMYASQFPVDPAACNRTLLLYDDALTAGLGYSARLISLALLVAVQENRVLIALPHSSARWCAREPYTLGCYYEPITHCPPPANTSASKWTTRGSSQGLEARNHPSHSPAQVRISTSQIHRSTFWYKFHPPQALHAATHELLFRPRPWVREAAHCLMDAAALRGGNFAAVHARYSVEKKKERGRNLPMLSEYLPATVALLAAANATRVFLQTSTPEAVDLFERWAAERRWSLSYTNNARSIHDIWMAGSGKRFNYSAAGERISVVAQAVNAHIASQARHFLSPASSMWTSFVRSLMARQIGDSFSDGRGMQGGELYEECLVATHPAAGVGGAASNGPSMAAGQQHKASAPLTQGDLKRCTRSAPKLTSIHRIPAARQWPT